MSALVDGAVIGLRTVASDRVSRSMLITVTAVSMITAQLAFRAWAVYGGWFTQDDLIFLSDVASGKADVSWLFHRHGVHFMPVGFLLAWAVGRTSPYNWGAAATELIVFQALASFGCWWMLRTLFGNRARILPPLAFFLFATISMPALMWWASGINILPAQLATILAITTHVLFLRTRRKTYAILAALSLGLGLLSYEKTILIPLVFGVLALCYFASGRLVSRLLTVLKRYWFGWVLYSLIAAIYLVLYVAASPAPSRGNDTQPDYVSTAFDFIANSLGTSLLGGPWRWLALPGAEPRLLNNAPQAGVSASLLVAALILIFGVSRYRGSLKPLYFIVPLVTISYLVIVTGRGGQLGGIATLEIRYWSDFMPYAALAIALFWMPLLGATDSLERRTSPAIALAVPMWAYVGFAGIFLIGSIWSSFTYVRPWHENFQTRNFIENVKKEFAGRERPVVLANETVPAPVLDPLTFPYNQPANLFAPLRAEFSVADMATDIETIDPYGSIVPGKVDGGFSVPPNALGRCIEGTADHKAKSIMFGVKTINYPFWMSIDYRSNEAGSITVIAGNNWRHSIVEKGEHGLFFRTDGAFDRATIAPSSGIRLCLDSIQIGPRIVPTS